eukprot:TRINITY_DN5085_c0_g1_i1.p2 TRINITY_DN5085_c0_g1~~TRINITY_DN5085_c0_g1_i1.p2  ORF type:complete len:206 (-),score=20.44 TRINITY_DN5085_c0_g1_i1:396-932(-)
MAGLAEQGKQCSDPYCRQCDFLPLTCDGCKRVFCRDHFAYKAHDCPFQNAKDRRVIICSVCTCAVPYPAGEDEEVVLKNHLASGACRPALASAAKPRCPVKGCKEKLTAINSFNCSTCSQRVCMKHRFEDQHECRPSAAKARTGGTISGLMGTCRSAFAKGMQNKMPHIDARIQRFCK